MLDGYQMVFGGYKGEVPRGSEDVDLRDGDAVGTSTLEQVALAGANVVAERHIFGAERHLDAMLAAADRYVELASPRYFEAQREALTPMSILHDRRLTHDAVEGGIEFRSGSRCCLFNGDASERAKLSGQHIGANEHVVVIATSYDERSGWGGRDIVPNELEIIEPELRGAR